MERLGFLDIAKGIGILLVILGHLLPAGSGYDWIYSFHLALFFIISGFIICRKPPEQKKIVRNLLVPYLFWSTIAMFYEMIIDPDLALANLKDDIYRIVTLRGVGPTWFLGILFLTEVIIVKIDCRKNRRKILVSLFVFLGLASGISLAMSSLATETGTLLFVVANILFKATWALSFEFFGMLLYTFYEKVPIKKTILIIIFAVTFMLSMFGPLINGSVSFHWLRANNPLLFFLFGVIGSLMVLCLSRVIEKSVVLENIGRNSLGIMVLHYKILPIWTLCFYIVDLLSIPNESLNVFIRLLLIAISSWAISALIMNRFPILFGKKASA